MNKSYFLARTCKDIEIRYTQNNKAVGRLSIAVDTGYGDNKKTSFFNCVAWEKTAETLEKFAPKGTKLLLECEAVQNQYEDKNGNKRDSVEFIIKNFFQTSNDFMSPIKSSFIVNSTNIGSMSY